MKKRSVVVVVKVEKMQKNRRNESEHLHERDSDTLFLCMVLRVKKNNWIVLRVKHQREGFYYYLYVWAYFLFAAGMPPTKTL